MIFPPLSDLMKRTDSRYSLVVATSKRARQISEEGTVLVECDSKKPVTLAIHELHEGVIQIVEDGKQQRSESQPEEQGEQAAC